MEFTEIGQEYTGHAVKAATVTEGKVFTAKPRRNRAPRRPMASRVRAQWRNCLIRLAMHQARGTLQPLESLEAVVGAR